jgi:hypothetical protein
MCSCFMGTPIAGFVTPAAREEWTVSVCRNAALSRQTTQACRADARGGPTLRRTQGDAHWSGQIGAALPTRMPQRIFSPVQVHSKSKMGER